MSKPTQICIPVLPKEPMPCRIKDGYEGAGRRGTYYGKVHIGQYWAIVVWDDDEDPATFKAAGIELEQPQWLPA